MKVYCVTLDGVLYDIFRCHSSALKRCRELKGSVVETWEVKDE